MCVGAGFGHAVLRCLPRPLQLLGCEEARVRFDHSLLMNRSPDTPVRGATGTGPRLGGGRTWHAHPYDQVGQEQRVLVT